MDTEVLVLASPIYYFTMNAQIQLPIQRMYCGIVTAKLDEQKTEQTKAKIVEIVKTL